MDPSSPTYELAVCRAASSLEVVTVTNFSLNRKIGPYYPVWVPRCHCGSSWLFACPSILPCDLLGIAWNVACVSNTTLQKRPESLRACVFLE